MQEIVELGEDHIEDAARLVSKRYTNLCEQNPHLPRRYTQASILRSLLENILKASCPGVAVINHGQLIGFLTGWQMPFFRGKRSTYSPEWANAANLEDSQRIYEEMYAHLAKIWMADNYIAHYISIFPNDVHALRTMYWLNFGMISVDALRNLDSVHDHHEIKIRRADLQDVEQVVALHEELQQYMKSAPVFLLTEQKERSYYEEWLKNPDKFVWLAYWDDEPVAFVRTGPADNDVSTIIYDEKTTSIYAAYTMDKLRGEGIATALLDHALKSTRAAGYERCAVSFEPMNLLGTRFWLKYFEPVCFSVVRYVDDRLTQR